MAATHCAVQSAAVLQSPSQLRHALPCRASLRASPLSARPATAPALGLPLTPSHVQPVPCTPSAPQQGRPGVCRALFGLGLPELLVIGGVAVVLFGPKQLPEIGKSLGKTVKGFQVAAKEFQTELQEAAKVEAKEGAAEPAADAQKVAEKAPAAVEGGKGEVPKQ